MRRSLAHLLEGAERVQLRGAHAPARKAAGCTLKMTQNVFSKARQSSLSLRARLLLAASLAHQLPAASPESWPPPHVGNLSRIAFWLDAYGHLKAAAASSGAASSSLARGGGGRMRGGKLPVARFECNFNIWKPFWFTVRGVVERKRTTEKHYE